MLDFNPTQTIPFSELVSKRHSVRHYDSSVKISKDELIDLLQHATLAPSGGNLQSWRFLVIDSPEQKHELFPIAYNQKQIVEASAVIAVLGDLKCFEMADKIYTQASDAGLMPKDLANSYAKRYTDYYSNMSPDEIRQTVCIDCGLASMQFMLAARAHGYDTGPMAGFDKEKFMTAFNLSDQYLPVLLITIGKAATPAHLTTRLPIEDVTFFNKVHR